MKVGDWLTNKRLLTSSSHLGVPPMNLFSACHLGDMRQSRSALSVSYGSCGTCATRTSSMWGQKPPPGWWDAGPICETSGGFPTMGVPQKWIVMEKKLLKWMMTGGSPILGNHPMEKNMRNSDDSHWSWANWWLGDLECPVFVSTNTRFLGLIFWWAFRESSAVPWMLFDGVGQVSRSRSLDTTYAWVKRDCV